MEQALLASSFDDDHVTAAALLEEVVDRRRAAGITDVFFVLACLSLGQELMELGELERARSLTEEARTIARDSGNVINEVFALTYLGNIAFAEGDPHEATRHYRDAISRAKHLHAPNEALLPLHAFGRLAAATGRFEDAAQLLAAVESALADPDDPTRPISPRIAPRHAATVNAVRSALGDTAFHAAWSTGATLTVDDAIGFALRE